jgi:predicted DNA-binding transcriptional regulator AlpA
VLDTAAVHRLTGVNDGTLRYWRSTDQGPAWFRLGERKIAYLRSDVERWLSQQLEQSFTDPSAPSATAEVCPP